MKSVNGFLNVNSSKVFSLSSRDLKRKYDSIDEMVADMWEFFKDKGLAFCEDRYIKSIYQNVNYFSSSLGFIDGVIENNGDDIEVYIVLFIRNGYNSGVNFDWEILIKIGNDEYYDNEFPVLKKFLKEDTLLKIEEKLNLMIQRTEEVFQKLCL